MKGRGTFLTLIIAFLGAGVEVTSVGSFSLAVLLGLGRPNSSKTCANSISEIQIDDGNHSKKRRFGTVGNSNLRKKNNQQDGFSKMSRTTDIELNLNTYQYHTTFLLKVLAALFHK
jgi:hypothetical protein